MKGIKNILFDLGGVWVDLNRQACIDEYEKLGFKNVSDFLGDYGQKGPFLKIEDGTYDENQFYNAIREYIPNASN